MINNKAFVIFGWETKAALDEDQMKNFNYFPLSFIFQCQPIDGVTGNALVFTTQLLLSP